MASLNKALLIGNLGKDPELRYTPSGKAVASFSIATANQWKDKDGQKQERTDWHNIVVWGRQAEIAKDYLRKGKQIYLEGRIQTRNYDDKDGNKRWITEIVADRFLMLGRKGDSGAADEFPPPPAESSAPAGAGNDDDLPF
jgi:single-strand DNA-binding protein